MTTHHDPGDEEREVTACQGCGALFEIGLTVGIYCAQCRRHDPCRDRTTTNPKP